MKDKAIVIVTEILDKHLKKLIDKYYPVAKLSKDDREYNKNMNKGSNLMIGILTQKQAQARKIEVEQAIKNFGEAQIIRPNAWAAINSEAKCLYLLSDYSSASKRNAIAKEHINYGLNDRPADKEKEIKREASFYNLESMINLALGKYDDAISQCVEGLSLTPNNIHMRLGYVRALCLKGEITSAIEQISVIESLDGFELWAHDFKARIEQEGDFKPLRKNSKWKEKSKEWDVLTEKAIKEHRESIEKEKDKKAKIKKTAGYAALLVITVGVNFAIGEIFSLLEIEGTAIGTESGGEESTSTEAPVQEQKLVDLEPFGGDHEIADLEPFGSESIEGAALDLEPFATQLASGNPWVSDLLIA
ncbi:MAG: hypothetical protein GKR94_33940 [Gammaproteobacteria bacterium]|nr:hypothetical protein [Gammaproteobacteria bacterium]